MKGEYTSGLRDGLAIGVGYFSVSFTFGILAVNGGLSPLVAGLISLTNMTSAGQFAGLTVILAHGSLVELALTQLVINLRYALMSLSLSQRLGPEFTTRRRMLVAFANTDEIFAVAMGRTAPLTPAYMYGLAALPILGWTGGTVVGAVAGAVLSPAVRSALGVALYSMFIAIVVPPMRHSKPVQAVVAAAVIVSCVLPGRPSPRRWAAALPSSSARWRRPRWGPGCSPWTFRPRPMRKRRRHDEPVLVSSGDGGRDLPHPHAAFDPVAEKDTQPAAAILFVLCALRLPFGHDLPGHPLGHREPGERRGGAGGGAGVALAGKGLVTVAACACATVFLVERLLPLLPF